MTRNNDQSNSNNYNNNNNNFLNCNNNQNSNNNLPPTHSNQISINQNIMGTHNPHQDSIFEAQSSQNTVIYHHSKNISQMSQGGFMAHSHSASQGFLSQI